MDRNKFFYFIVNSFTLETADSMSISLNPVNAEKYRYKPGQFLTVEIENDAIGVIRRAYSFSSFEPEDISITVKRISNGKMSNYLFEQLRVGDILKTYGPEGTFIWQQHSDVETAYFIAVGSGITPIFSLINQLLYKTEIRVVLFYGNRYEEDIIFRKNLESLQLEFSGRFIVYFSLTKPSNNWKGLQGRINIHIEEMVDQLSSKESCFYICGMEGLVNQVSDYLLNAGISSERIFYEFFSASTVKNIKVVENTTTIKLDGNNYTIQCDSTSSILDQILKYNIDAPYLCNAGNCSSCKAKLLIGSVTAIERAIEKDGSDIFIKTCQSYIQSEELYIDFDYYT